MDKIENKKQEKEFQEFLLHSSIPQMKTGMWVTLALFILFRLTTLAFFGDSLTNQYFLRFGAIIPFIIATLVVLYIRVLQKRLRSLLTIITSLSGLGIFIVGASSSVSEPGYEYYPIWVMLVIMGTFVYYRIRNRDIQIIGAILVLSYLLANIYNKSIWQEPMIFTIHMFFIIAMTILGYFISGYRYQANLKIFLQKKELDAKNEKLLTEIRQKEISETALIESEMQHRNLLDSLPDNVYVLDKDMRFVMINKAHFEKNARVGLTEDFTGKHITQIYPFLPHERIGELEEVLKTGKPQVKESSQIVFGEMAHSEIRTIPVFHNNRPVQVMVIVRDISKKLEVEQLKQKNIQQKEVLLREIHHRVKNNLAIVISLLDMQVRNNPNPEFIKLSREIEYRIRSMALIHEHLYKSEELDKVPLDKYFVTITNGIVRTFGSQNIKTIFNCELVDASIEMAMPLGLIVNEILTNAFKYAFPGKRQGEISIDLKQEDTTPGYYRLTIRDNGVGLRDGFSVEDQTSMGLFIIKLLSDQISARLIIENHKGTSFSIIFKGIGSDN